MKKRIACIICMVLAVLMFVPNYYAYGAESEVKVNVPVVMYHHINKNSKYWNDYTISPDKFREDLEYIKSNGYNVITAAQLIAFSNGEGELPEKPILLTFDDGFESFMTYAVPLLEEYGMSAVMAVVGHYTDIYSESEDHNINYSHLNWEELRQLDKSPNVELAVHTYDMHSLGDRRGCKIKPGEDAQQFKAEFNADLEKVENEFLENLGSKPQIFAYPYGLYCDEAKEILIEHGYKILFTCDEHVNEFSGKPEELLKIGRFNRPNKMTSQEFFRKLACC